MKTVAEIADQCGVSKVAIYKRINGKMKDDLKPYIVKQDNVTHILPEGIELIEQSFEDSKQVKGGDKSTTTDNSTNGEIKGNRELLNRLEQDYIETLKAELERKNEQLEKKDELLRNFQVIVQQNQEKIQQLEGEVKEQKQGFWARLRFWN